MSPKGSMRVPNVFACFCGCRSSASTGSHVHTSPHTHRYVSLWPCVSPCVRVSPWARLSPPAPGVSAMHLPHLSPIACVTSPLWMARLTSMYGSETQFFLEDISLNKANSFACSLFPSRAEGWWPQLCLGSDSSPFGLSSLLPCTGHFSRKCLLVLHSFAGLGLFLDLGGCGHS